MTFINNQYDGQNKGVGENMKHKLSLHKVKTGKLHCKDIKKVIHDF